MDANQLADALDAYAAQLDLPNWPRTDPRSGDLRSAADVLRMLDYHDPNTPITTAIPAADSPTKSRRLVGWRVRWVCADLDIRSGITTLVDAWRIARELRRSPKNEGVRIVRVYLVRRGK